jgi:hypothetical protein
MADNGDNMANKGAEGVRQDAYGTSPYAGVQSNSALLSAVASHTAEVEHSGGNAPSEQSGSPSAEKY